MATIWKCVAETSTAVIRQAHRTPHAAHTLSMPAKTSLTCDKIDAPAACAAHFVHIAIVL